MQEPFLLHDAIVHLDRGAMCHHRNVSSYWRDTERSELATGYVTSVFSYDATWDYQEMHPTGDELAVVLEGRIELLLDDGSGEEPVPLGKGEGCIIKTRVWHRLGVVAPATLMFITPAPRHTEHRPSAHIV